MLFRSRSFRAIHYALTGGHKLGLRQWQYDKLAGHEHIAFARALAKLAQFECQRRGRVPGWILEFVLYSLSEEAPPPTSVIADCLSVIASGLGCDVWNTRTMILDDGYVHPPHRYVNLSDPGTALD